MATLQRQVWNLLHEDKGQTWQQLAEKSSLSVSTLRSALYRLRQKRKVNFWRRMDHNTTYWYREVDVEPPK